MTGGVVRGSKSALALGARASSERYFMLQNIDNGTDSFVFAGINHAAFKATPRLPILPAAA